MATIAVRPRARISPRVGVGAAILVGSLGTVLSWFGSGWDVSWHRVLGRDTFWSEPHVFIYVGVTLWGLAALIATATAMAGRPIRGPELRIGPLRAERGLALVGLGALVTILAAPFDNLWHALYGRDVDIWSPPHLVGIAGGAIGLAGWISAYRSSATNVDPYVRRVLLLATLGNICAVGVFSMNFYYVNAVTREAFFYPLLVSALVPGALALAVFAIPGRWAVTSGALAYTAIALIGYILLAGGGWRAPAFPPLVIAGAVAIDLLRSRGGLLSRPIALGFAFAVTFVVAETVRMALFPPPLPVASGLEPRLTALFFHYYDQTLARSWQSLWPAAAAIAGGPVAAASWRIGLAVGRRLTQELDPQAVAHP